MGINRTYQGLWDVLQATTQGKSYAFVIMPFGSHFDVYRDIKAAVEGCGMQCVRADEVQAGGFGLFDLVQFFIERAEVVIAIISDPNLNVYYEVGYAVALHKPIILLADDLSTVPSDLKGRVFLVCGKENTRASHDKTENDLRSHILQLYPRLRLLALRDMLEADTPAPAYIVASPRNPIGTTDEPIEGRLPDLYTYGDNLGVVGLLRAFGSIMGESSGIELVSGRNQDLNFLNNPYSLYLIGSNKVNQLTHELMEIIAKEYYSPWSFGPAPGELSYSVALFERVIESELRVVPCERNTKEISGRTFIVTTEDHGLILRIPHPRFPNRIVLIMAGPHSLGTGAACLAATQVHLIHDIQALLPNDVHVRDKQVAFWALISGKSQFPDYHLHVEDVKVERAGLLIKR